MAALQLHKLTASQRRQLHILRIIGQLADGQVDVMVSTEELQTSMAKHPELSAPFDLGELELLNEAGWVHFAEAFDGTGILSLKRPGAMQIKDIEESLSSVIARRIVLRDVYLSWLYEQIDGLDHRPSPQDFIATEPSIVGEPFTDADVEHVGKWLAANGFIKGTAAMQYAGPLRPDLTEKGRWTVENQRSVNEPAPGTSSTTINNTVHGAGNIAFDSPGAYQVAVNDSVWIEQSGKLATALEKALPALPADIGDQIREALSELQQELAGSPEKSRVRSALKKINSFLGQATAGALGNVLSEQVKVLLSALL